MATMNLSPPEALKAFIDQQVEGGRFGTCSEYVGELIRRDQERLALCDLLIEGGSSLPTSVADTAYFEELRRRASDIRPR